MDDYLIGAGAILTAGPQASVRGATLHAQAEPALARQVRAAVIDFESSGPAQLSRVLILAAGWAAARFHAEVVVPLIASRECTLADVMGRLAEATGTAEVHLFARWLPDRATEQALARRGIRAIVHPLEAIAQAALVTGQRVERWSPPVRAA